MKEKQNDSSGKRLYRKRENGKHKSQAHMTVESLWWESSRKFTRMPFLGALESSPLTFVLCSPRFCTLDFASILFHDLIWGGHWSYAFPGGFTVIISQFLLAQVSEPKDYFRDWRVFCRPSLWFLGSYYLIRNLGGFWSLCAQSVPWVGNSGQRSGLGTSFKYKSSWCLLSSVVSPFSFT